MTEASGSGEGVAAVDRALSIVIALEEAASPVTLAELSRLTGLYKSTLLRLIHSLEHAALVVRRSDGRYTLGPLAARLGRAFDATHRLHEHLLPVLERLVEQGTESSSFHVRYDNDRRLCLFRVDSHHSTLDSVREGDLLPLERGAAAKIIRHYTSAEHEQASKEDPPLLFSSFGERDPLCAALASPVWGAGNQFLGAISLSGPKERFTSAAVETMGEVLLKEAKKLTETLGGAWPARRRSSR